MINWIFSQRREKPLFVFLHIPKCAGTSLLSAFSKVGRSHFAVIAKNGSKSAAMDSVKSQMDEYEIRPNELDLIMGHDAFFGIHRISERKPYYFTFLRDPVERYVSQWRFLMDCATNRQHESHRVGLEHLKSANGGLLSLKEFSELGRDTNWMCRVLGSASPSRTSNDHFWNTDGEEAFDLAVEMLNAMEFIGFVDTLESDARYMCDQLDVRFTLPRKNCSEASYALDELTVARIKENNTYDLKLYEIAEHLRLEKLGSTARRY